MRATNYFLAFYVSIWIFCITACKDLCTGLHTCIKTLALYIGSLKYWFKLCIFYLHRKQAFIPGEMKLLQHYKATNIFYCKNLFYNHTTSHFRTMLNREKHFKRAMCSASFCSVIIGMQFTHWLSISYFEEWISEYKELPI